MISCVYSITNIATNKLYIGSTNNYKIRVISHKSTLKNNKHRNIKLQNAYNKYGIDSFNFDVLAICPVEYLPKLEQKFIDVFKPEYNIALDTKAFRRGKINSPEHQSKIIATREAEGVNKQTSERMKGNTFAKGITRTKEQITKLQEARKDKFIKQVAKLSRTGQILEIFDSTVEAAISVEVTYKAIYRAIKTHEKDSNFGTCKGYYWRYL